MRHIASAFAFSALVGALTILSPVTAIAVVGVSVLALAVHVFNYKAFWYYTLFLLTGYLFLGRGFAYIGVRPVYIGEVGVAICVATFLVFIARGEFPRVKRSPSLPIVLLLIYVAWNVPRALPYIPEHGTDTLRDSAVWGYSIFTFAIYWFVPKTAIIRFIQLYGRVVPYYLVWTFWAMLFNRLIHVHVSFPGSPVSLIHLRSGVVGFQLAGAAVFMLLRMDRGFREWKPIKIWIVWVFWMVGWFSFGVTSRGASLAGLLGPIITVCLQPKVRWDRPVIVGIVMIIILGVGAVNLTIYDSDTEYSLDQHFRNFQSLVGEGDESLEGTADWRLNGWATAVDKVIHGPFFWTGLGYGVNLAYELEMQPFGKENRYPHNVFTSILGRAGVPGLTLWCAFLLSSAWTLVRRVCGTGSSTVQDRNFALWMLAFIASHLLNSSTANIIEGPVGGITFWCLAGLSLAYFNEPTRTSRTETGASHTLSKSSVQR